MVQEPVVLQKIVRDFSASWQCLVVVVEEEEEEGEEEEGEAVEEETSHKWPAYTLS
jgi:hypothetical protein